MKKKRFFAGENIKTENANWSFKGSVPKNFDKHIVKSVPLYGTKPNNSSVRLPPPRRNAEWRPPQSRGIPPRHSGCPADR